MGHALKPSITASEGAAGRSTNCPGVVPEALNPECDGYERADGEIGVGARDVPGAARDR